KNNILFSLDGTLLTSYRENPSIPCSQFFFSISTSTDSKIHFTHSRIDHLNGIIPIGNMEFVFIDGCNFTLNSLFYPLNGANLTLFEVKNNLFHGQNSLGSRVIDIFNYSGVAVIHNNYFEKFEHNVVAQNINLLLYTK